ncbi:MAG: carbohydrate ABC transporter permease [Oscillospiraceae bacterium]|nr:carbohydrate ABC transporter permease [Oscillospiraceae bacterium]
MKKKFSLGRALIIAVLVVYTILLFFPIVTILLTSFIPSEELATSKGFIWWSNNMSIDAYKTIFQYDSYIDLVGMPGLLMGFINTMWLTLIPLVVGMIVAGFSAYAFSKMNFPFKEPLFKFSVILRSIPLGAFGVISFVFFSAIGWTGEAGYLPLLIPGLFGSIGTMFFLRLFFDGIPNSLIEAATLDGAGFFQCFFKIMFPLAKPAFIAQFIFGFVAGYNSYLGPMLYLQNQPRFITLQLYLSEIRSMFPNAGSENIYSAAAVLGMLPLILIYVLLQKYFIEGVSAGGVKE